ncbi:MAG: hypothetical protein HOC74_06940 [Gemmatimonadetes bacterium]|jgi:hypothetical protein|nr:hypothetical protein [Gemmatimonadota bacterium]
MNDIEKARALSQLDESIFVWEAMVSLADESSVVHDYVLAHLRAWPEPWSNLIHGDAFIPLWRWIDEKTDPLIRQLELISDNDFTTWADGRPIEPTRPHETRQAAVTRKYEQRLDEILGIANDVMLGDDLIYAEGPELPGWDTHSRETGEEFLFVRYDGGTYPRTVWIAFEEGPEARVTSGHDDVTEEFTTRGFMNDLTAYIGDLYEVPANMIERSRALTVESLPEHSGVLSGGVSQILTWEFGPPSAGAGWLHGPGIAEILAEAYLPVRDILAS